MSVKDRLLNALEPLGYQVLRQGTIGPDGECEDDLITYYIVDTMTERSYDNEPAITSWLIYITFYSYDAQLVEDERVRIVQTLRAAGFLPDGKGRDALSEDAGQTGWEMKFYFLEVENGRE